MSDLESRGLPSVGVATTEFVDAADVQARAIGFDAAYVFIPHPVQDRTDEELRMLADAHFEAIVAMLMKGN